MLLIQKQFGRKTLWWLQRSSVQYEKCGVWCGKWICTLWRKNQFWVYLAAHFIHSFTSCSLPVIARVMGLHIICPQFNIRDIHRAPYLNPSLVLISVLPPYHQSIFCVAVSPEYVVARNPRAHVSSNPMLIISQIGLKELSPREWEQQSCCYDLLALSCKTEC